ncbi:MAG TPA: winged helix-turn-helix transcriptional regulator [Candidatus Aphodomonas merdavium]|nr:winged helix-turn-helix transcriptional regulator [Candidatus Aphodomonas merdavium]
MNTTLAYYATVLSRDFTAYTGKRLQQLSLSYGALFLLLYVGKHPGCTQAALTEALGLDWGYSQRSVAKLTADGFLLREKRGRAYCLSLSEKGAQAFAVAHQVFFDWDEQALQPLTPQQREQLLSLLSKINRKEFNPTLCMKR